MSSIRIPSVWLILASAWLLAACAPLPGTSGEIQSSVPSSTSSPAPVLASSGNYAAMEEIPVTGGELRLATPIELSVEVTAADPAAGAVPRDQQAVEAIAFPLKHTDVDIEVSGAIAAYTVEQTFENPFSVPIEAVYLFPLGDNAAVIGYRIVIGERTIEGEIERREKAREIYEEARSRGHTAALLEQDKPNLFEQHIANIAPGETIAVRFRYVETLHYADDGYELVFPMTVGPRYLPPDRPGRRPIGAHHAGATPSSATSIPYLAAELLDHQITLRVRIDAGVPILGTTSSTHEIDLRRVSETSVRVELPEHERLPNRDLVLRYQVASSATMVGLMPHRTSDQGYFLMLVQPKAEYRTGDVVAREVIFLIDRSGSMDGEPLAQAKALAKVMIGTLTERDVFNVIAFASGTDMLAARPIPGDARGRAQGTAWVEQVAAGGATEMERGLLASLASRPGNDRVRMVYLLSDGFIGNDDVILSTAESKLGHNRIFPVGVGSSPNRYLFDRLARTGRGFASYLAPAEPADALATDLVRRSAYPYLTDLEINWGGLSVSDVTPAVVPDVYAGMPLVVSGRYDKPGRARVEIEATAAGRRVTIPVDVVLPERADRPAVGYLWARDRVRELMALNQGEITSDVRERVARIGLAFHMVTEFTSFVAVDRSRVVDARGKVRTVVQPAAGPAGVNLDTAIGSRAEQPSSYSGGSYSSSGSSGSSGGGDHWGGGDTDPLTLLILLLFLPAAAILRRTQRG